MRFLYIRTNLILAIVFSLAILLTPFCLKGQSEVVLDKNFIFSKRKDVAVFWIYLEKGDSIDLKLEIGKKKEVGNVVVFQKESPLDKFRNNLNHVSALLRKYDLTLSAIDNKEYLRYTSAWFCSNEIQSYRYRLNYFRTKIDSVIKRLDYPLYKLRDSLTFLPVSILDNPDSLEKAQKSSLLSKENTIQDSSIATRGSDTSFSEVAPKNQDSKPSTNPSEAGVRKGKEEGENPKWKEEQQEFESWLHDIIILLADDNQDRLINKAITKLDGKAEIDTSFTDSISIRKERLFKYLVKISPQVDTTNHRYNLSKISQKWHSLIAKEKDSPSLFSSLNKNPIIVNGLLKLISEVSSIPPEERKAYIAKIKQYGLNTLKVKGGEIIASKAVNLSDGLSQTTVNPNEILNPKRIEATIINSNSLIMETGEQGKGSEGRPVKNDGIYEVRIINKGWFKNKKKSGRIKITRIPPNDSIEYIKYDTIRIEKTVSKKQFHYKPKNDTQEVYLQPQLNYFDDRITPITVSIPNNEEAFWGFWYGYSNSPSPTGQTLSNPLFSYIQDSIQTLFRDKNLNELNLKYLPHLIKKNIDTTLTKEGDKKVTEFVPIKSIIKYGSKDKPLHDNYGYIKTPIQEIKTDSIHFEIHLSTTNQGSGRNVFFHTVLVKGVNETTRVQEKVVECLIPAISKRGAQK